MPDRSESEASQEDLFCSVEEISDDIFRQLTISSPKVRADVAVVEGHSFSLGMLSEFLLAAGSALRGFRSSEPLDEKERADYVVLLGETRKERSVLAPASSRLDPAHNRSTGIDKHPDHLGQTEHLSSRTFPHLPSGIRPLESAPSIDSEEEMMARIRAIMIDQRREQSKKALPVLLATEEEPKMVVAKRKLPEIDLPDGGQRLPETKRAIRKSSWALLSLAVLPVLLVQFSNYEALLLLVISAFTTFAGGYTIRAITKPFG